MQLRRIALAGTLLLIGLVAVVGSLYALSVLNNVPHANNNTAPSTANSQVPITTLEDIMGGKFPSAADKDGTDGILVEVNNLQVEKVLPESDGDWHVYVTDGIQSVFITEITPFWQDHGVTQPQIGSVIDEVGTPYCDQEHANEGWHDNTCWEIHPVESWKLYGGSNPVSSTPTIISQEYSIGIGSTLGTLLVTVTMNGQEYNSTLKLLN